MKKKKKKRKNRYKHTKRNTKIYVVRPLAYVHGLQQEKISLINMENTKWCGSILTKPNPITPKIILSCKQKLSLSQYKAEGQLQSSRLHLKQGEVFASLKLLQSLLHTALLEEIFHTRILPCQSILLQFLLHPNCQTSHINHIYLIKKKTK